MKKYLVGTVTLDKDREMTNYSFSYAASFETLLVKAGTYPIYVCEGELNKWEDGVVVRSVEIGFSGIVIAGNVGNKPGTHSEYHPYRSGYDMAAAFLRGCDEYNRKEWYDVHYTIGSAFTVRVADFVAHTGERILLLELIRKDGEVMTELEEAEQ